MPVELRLSLPEKGGLAFRPALPATPSQSVLHLGAGTKELNGRVFGHQTAFQVPGIGFGPPQRFNSCGYQTAVSRAWATKERVPLLGH